MSRPRHTQRERAIMEVLQPKVDQSVYHLYRSAPEMSALKVWSGTQLAVLAAVGTGLVALGIFNLLLTLQVLIGATTAVYFATLVYRVILVRRGLRSRLATEVSDTEARSVPAEDLPVYTVLVPAFREPQIIEKVMSAIQRLDYPLHKLDVRLLLEEDDFETIGRALEGAVSGEFSVVLVPPGGPRTKPKACNFGLLDAKGEYVTIFDAEDCPEPLQLRRAVVAMRRLGPRYACVQARLAFYNWAQNRITKWFEIEYGTLFQILLPGLAAVGSVIPLGGTSNHFRTDVLRSVGAWDAHNVTEDADLGVRLARSGYAVGVLNSVTQEEANSDFVNWVKQRSRWYKGYLITWLVHMRNPLRLRRELGWRGVLGLNLFVLGTPLTSLLNPIFWALTIMWFARRPAGIEALFTPVVFYPALACMLLGNAAVLYIGVLAVRVMRRPELLWSAFLSPVYWVMMSAAAMKAAYQLVTQASFWEKTTHGLDIPMQDMARKETATQ